MKDFFLDLFEYSHVQNQQLADTFAKGQEQLTERAIQLYCHIVNAHLIWISRIESTKIAAGVWDVHSLEASRLLDKINLDQTRILLNGYALDASIQYTNSQGQMFRNTVQEILFHIVNHSTYHRGQIAMELRQNGLEPLATDYIFYKR